jgi:hypothetical protein
MASMSEIASRRHLTWRITMHDRQDRKSSISGAALAAIVVAFVLVVALLLSGRSNTGHVASNPGPSGTPGSTAVERTPPPADSPSGNTIGTAR